MHNKDFPTPTMSRSLVKGTTEEGNTSPLLTVLALSQNVERAPTTSISTPDTPTTLLNPNAVA